MHLAMGALLGVARGLHELIVYLPTQHLKLATGLQGLGDAYAMSYE